MLGGPASSVMAGVVEGQMAQSTPLPVPASYTNQGRGSWDGVEAGQKTSLGSYAGVLSRLPHGVSSLETRWGARVCDHISQGPRA